METAPGKVNKMAEKRESENWEFRSFLKRCDLPSEEIDSIVHRLYRKIASEIDCKACANCCKEVQPALDNEDIEKFSKGLGISIDLFKNRYLIMDNKSQKYIFNQKPCPFLKAKLCSCYAYRPKDCISYPHLHKADFTSRLINIIGNCSICPIVFNVYECLKSEVWYDDDDFEEFSDFY